MLAGAMRGWADPAADPKNYDEPAVLLVAHQGLHDALQLLLKFLGVQVLPVTAPLGEKALAWISWGPPFSATTPPRSTNTLSRPPKQTSPTPSN